MKKKKNRRHHPTPRREGAHREASPKNPPKPLPERPEERAFGWRAALALIFFAVFVGTYWPNWVRIVGKWASEPDYSHGFLVIPFVAWCGWRRRETLPASRFSSLGLLLIVAGVAMRVFGGMYYIDAVEDWSMLLWLGGATWLIWGGRVFWWAAPLIGFLFFMTPLPFGLEEAMARPLQAFATKASTWSLQLLGQPALANGNEIHVGKQILDVERACSGLRIFMSMVAMGIGFLLFNPNRPWWVQATVLAATVPIALISNVTRIVATGLLHTWVSSAAAHQFSHAFAGWGMILFAMVLFVLMLKYLDALFPVATDMRKAMVAPAVAPRQASS
ncbi:MAG: exosortase/archaeosortase family protein [Planctomycetales bacterium]|nr:exosortase/archaeosortase family protein [Planctomycetales bacterium]